jgi:hypothetical protein
MKLVFLTSGFLFISREKSASYYIVYKIDSLKVRANLGSLLYNSLTNFNSVFSVVPRESLAKRKLMKLLSKRRSIEKDFYYMGKAA